MEYAKTYNDMIAETPETKYKLTVNNHLFNTIS